MRVAFKMIKKGVSILKRIRTFFVHKNMEPSNAVDILPYGDVPPIKTPDGPLKGLK
jgi:hypothetical protein